MWHCLNTNADKWTTAWWKTPRCRSRSRSAVQAEQETENQPQLHFLVCSCRKCRFEAVISIFKLLNDTISCWCPYWTLPMEIICNIRILHIWRCKCAPESHFGPRHANYIRTYFCRPDAWHLSSFRIFTVQVPLGCACGDSVGKTNPLMWDIIPKIVVYLWKGSVRCVRTTDKWWP